MKAIIVEVRDPTLQHHPGKGKIGESRIRTRTIAVLTRWVAAAEVEEVVIASIIKEVVASSNINTR